MSGNMDCRQELDTVFADLEHEFAKVSLEISGYDAELKEQVEKLARSTIQRNANGNVREDHPLLAHYAAIRTHIELECAAWRANLQKNHMNREFRDKFNESMLVYVYGKVKSAKSSLGNFLAYGKHDPAKEDVDAQPGIVFDVEQVSDVGANDREKLEKQKAATRSQRKFLVDFFEATACIQYFKKPGFTWIDSPGIHSTTAKNGELAANYLGCADLVVYTMPSRSPGRDTDREQIRRIIKSGKKLLIIVTKCDEVVTDEDEQTGMLTRSLEMLTDTDREEIKESCLNDIMNDLGSDAPAQLRDELKKNTVTLSVRYAEEHPQEPGWSESGVRDFYRVLADIARSEGVRLKMQAPLRLILADIEVMQESVGALKTQLGDLEAQLSKVRSTLEQQARTLAMNGGRGLEHEVMTIAREHIGDDDRFRQRVRDAAERALEHTSGQLARTIARDTLELTGKLERQALNTDDLPTYQDIYQTITYHTTTKKRGGTLLGAIAGAVGGFLIGGPAGAAIGVGIGSMGGGAVGSSMDGSRSSQVKVGDNSLDVGRAAAQGAREWLETSLDTLYKGITETCLAPLQAWLQATQAELREFEDFLSAKKHSLENEVGA